jgi:thioredoxin-dependent peroxiredoxin
MRYLALFQTTNLKKTNRIIWKPTMNYPKIGNLAPSFSLKNQHESVVNLKDFKGKKNVVLYFYPKALTPGCTTQACGIRDTAKDFAKLDTVVFGISPDAPSKLTKFIEKHDLNFDLLSDEDHAVAEKYGVWSLKQFMGKEFMGIVRTSFIIDKEGKLKHVINKVNTKTHDQDLLEILRSGI